MSVVSALLVSACAGQVVDGSGSVGRVASHALSARQVYLRGRRGTVQIAGQVGMTPDEYQFGSGVLYDRRGGLVITNAHVVDGVQGTRVRFANGAASAATVVGRSPCDDIAVLKVDHVPASARSLVLGNSSHVKVADQVYVIGYPGTLAAITSERAVFTQGSVQSVRVRVDQIDDLPTYRDTIQHSATVNHGNSGGPLLNDRAQVVGINTLSNYGTPAEQVQGQYYSISINLVKSLLPQLASGHSVDYAGWNLAPLDDVSLPSLFRQSGYGSGSQGRRAAAALASDGVNGLVVTGVDPGTPAASADIKPGQLLTTIAGRPVRTVSDVCSALKSAGSNPTSVSGLQLIAGQNYTAAWNATLTP